MDVTGNGRLEKYFDKQIYVEFQEIVSENNNNVDNNNNDNNNVDNNQVMKYFVIGKGDSEFGPFLLSGSYNINTKVLDMCRQYIDPNKINTNTNTIGNNTHTISTNLNGSNTNSNQFLIQPNNVETNNAIENNNNNDNLINT